jgi:hypothetical protein
VVRVVPLALDRQQAVLEGDLQIVDANTGQLDCHQVGVLAFGDVQGRDPRRLGSATTVVLAELTKPLGPQPVESQQLILRIAQVFEQVPAGNNSHVVLPCIWPDRRPGGPARKR